MNSLLWEYLHIISKQADRIFPHRKHTSKNLIVWTLYYFHKFKYSEFCQSAQGIFAGGELINFLPETPHCQIVSFSVVSALKKMLSKCGGENLKHRVHREDTEYTEDFL